MIFTDYIVLLALVVCVCCWWKRSLKHGSSYLIAAAMVVILVGAWSIFDDRWQAGFAILPAVLILLGLLLGRNRPRKGIPWISGTLLSLLTVFAILLVHFFPATNLPVPSGTYAVGVRNFELKDTSRLGVMAADPQEPRRLLVRVWYPAGDTTGLKTRAYFSPPEVDTTGVALGRFLNAPFAFKYLKHVDTNSYENAPLAADVETAPVVIYSHGYASFAGQNTALMEELASHGYTVYSIQHTFDSAPTVFPNGDVLDSDPKLMEELRAASEPSESMKRGFIGASFAERRAGQLETHETLIAANQRIAARSSRIWTQDRIFVHDQLQAGAVPEEVLDVVNVGDFTRTGQIGMSFGGSATGEVCMVDKRCAAGVNLDGSDFHFASFGNNEPVPFMMFYSDFQNIAMAISGDPSVKGNGFNDFSYERPETAGMRPDVVRLQVHDVTHLGVSDFPLFVRMPLRNSLFGSIDSHAMIQIQNDFVLGFFDTYVRHRAGQFPAEQFGKHKAWVEPQDMTALREDWLKTHPEDETVRVVMETDLGEIEVALYPERAPAAVANFLTYVDSGQYDGASFYRVSQAEGSSSVGAVQGGLIESKGLGLKAGEIAATNDVFPPTAHEAPGQTGIANETGTLSVWRLVPGAASSEFFFNTEDNPELDSGNTALNPGGGGHTTMGRVLRGLPVLRAIQAMPSNAATANDFLMGELLNQPVTIDRVYRVKQSSL